MLALSGRLPLGGGGSGHLTRCVCVIYKKINQICMCEFSKSSQYVLQSFNKN